MSGAELAARMTAARAARDDFEREYHAYTAERAAAPGWQLWAERLSAELGSLLDALDGGPAAAVTLDEAQLDTVLDALDDAAGLRHESGDPGRAARYAASARQLRQEAGR